MTEEELTNTFSNIANNLKLENSDNIPDTKFLEQVFQPNNPIGVFLLSLYTMLFQGEEIVIEDNMLESYTNAIREQKSNPLVLMTNTLVMLGAIEKIEDTPTRIKYKFINEEMKNVFKELEKIELERLKNKYLEMYEKGASKEEVLVKIMKDLEYESKRLKNI